MKSLKKNKLSDHKSLLSWKVFQEIEEYLEQIDIHMVIPKEKQYNYFNERKRKIFLDEFQGRRKQSNLLERRRLEH